MDWFLYDNGLPHERVNSTAPLIGGNNHPNSNNHKIMVVLKHI